MHQEAKAAAGTQAIETHSSTTLPQPPFSSSFKQTRHMGVIANLAITIIIHLLNGKVRRGNQRKRKKRALLSTRFLEEI